MTSRLRHASRLPFGPVNAGLGSPTRTRSAVMSSLKSMMAAKKAQHRITAPHAKYSNSGQLSCALCGLAIKHESLWGAHVQSKVRRVTMSSLAGSCSR